ncbi:MAG TPA: hypothetical protein VFS00_00420 [Polyangiaceae bacterium]|nr:hypothetical protein [Polyangiaceae bacterium]
MDPIGSIRSILSKYVSPITGEAIIAGALRRLRPGASELGAANLERVVRALDRGIDLFVVEDRRAALRAELAAFMPAVPSVPAPLTLEINDEGDVERARELASSFCERMGAPPSSTWKVVSGVVALAGQLAALPSPGLLEILPLPDLPRGVRVRAVGRYAPPGEGRTPLGTPRLPPSASRTPLGTPRPPPAAGPSASPPAAGEARSSPAPPPPRPSSSVPPASPVPPAPPGIFDGASPTIRRVADRFDVTDVGNRTHVEFDVWFSSMQRPPSVLPGDVAAGRCALWLGQVGAALR